MSSSRLHSVRTGAFRPAARAALAISQASTTKSLPLANRRPKPPPAICTCTVTCSGLRPSARAAAAASRPGHWEPVHTPARPGKLNRAVQRLHGGVSEVGEHELGFEFAGGRVQRRHVGVELACAGAIGQRAVVGQLSLAVDLLHG